MGAKMNLTNSPETERETSATSGIPILTPAVNSVALPMAVEATIESIDM